MRGQGRVFLRGKTWWLSYYHRGRELRESSGSKKRADAERLLRNRLRTAGTAAFVGPKEERLSFDDLAALLVEDYALNNRLVEDAERLTSQLRTFFGCDYALEIADRVPAYVRTRRCDHNKSGSLIANGTVNRELSALRRMFTLAWQRGMVTSRPYIPMMREENVREGFFDPAEFDVLAAGLPPDVADFARFAFLTGWRFGEIQSLEWRDVSLESGTIRLRRPRSKNRSGRVLALEGGLLDLVRHRANLRRLECPYVFHRQGRQIRSIRNAWQKACEQAGMTGRLFHDLRRSAVRNMVRAGVPLNVAKAISGHKTDSVFRRYDIVNEKDIASALATTQQYVDQLRTEGPRICPLRSPGSVRKGTRTKHGQSGS